MSQYFLKSSLLKDKRNCLLELMIYSFINLFKSEKVVVELKRNQHIACREGWFDNLTQCVFHIPYSAVTETDRKKIDAKYDKLLKQVDEDFVKAVEEAINKGTNIVFFLCTS